ncbi:MAG: translocation/assembly module TamB domain-containing protein [Terrimicrobiaceae bacterium]|nr:translocation/assembly module TamB domain-containing protein [Terrimicrobiaceae bacterium]
MAIDSTDSASSRPRGRSRRFRLWPWLLLAVAIAFWFGHEPALIWSARKAISTFGPRLGVRLEVGAMRLHLFQPIELREIRFRVTNPPASSTDVTAGRISLTANSLWEILFGDGRVFSQLDVDGIRGTFDFRKPALIPQPMPTLTREKQEQLAALTLRFLPKALRLRSSGAVFLADGQAYTLRGVDGDFTEAASGELTVKSALIQAGSIRQEIVNGRAATAWKDGALYLSDLRLRDEIIIRDFVANFVNLGGVSLDWDVGAYGGTVRGNIVFGSEEDELRLAASVAVVNLPIKPIPGLIALPVRADGIVRDARITFRGNPDHPLDDEISLRVSADNFRWNERGWQSLVAGANYIGRRLYLSTFDLAQADNRISANGELAIPEQLKDVRNAHYFVNLAADVRDLAALSALAGPPFDQLGGQFYLHGTIQGDNGRLSGYLNGEASGIRYLALPPASARLSLVAQNDELQIRYANLWAGSDRIEAKGGIGIREPHRYTGELTGRIEDLGIYAPFAGAAVAQNVFTGAATLDWQGDGTMTANSGSFHVRLDHMVTSATPTGLTGEFAATYSPENIYFKTVRLTHAQLELNSQLTISASGVNVTGLSLRRGKLSLLAGEGFVPLNVFALSAGKTLAQALATDKPVYADFTSGDLPVAELIQMAGQKASVRGRLRGNLGASGTLPRLELAGQLIGRDLSATIEDFTIPATTADIALGTRDGRIDVKGSIQTRGFQPMTLDAHMPFAYEETRDGLVRLFHHDAPISAKLSFPGTSLEIFRPFVPAARRLQGALAGNATVAGTLNAPKIDGEATLSGGDIELSPDLPRINALGARVLMNTSRITLESLRGEVGAGPFEASGWADLTNPQQPRLHLQFKGSKILLARDPGLRLRADLDIAADGRGTDGAITGEVRFVEGRIFKKIEVTPFLVPNPVSGPAFAIPNFAGLVPEPWGRWKLDVSIKNGTPFLLLGNLATGEIAPDLAVRGTLAAPYLEGTISLKNLQAYLPATTLLIPDGKIYFTPQNPFMPIMDVRARADVSGYNVQMYAYGPLSEQNLALRSDPPLSQENLIFLLTTGLTPAGMSGAGLGEAAAGQGGIILLRSLVRQLEPFGIDLNDFVNRLSVRVVPPKDSSQASSLMSELRLTDRFSLTTGRDGYGFYNAGVQYTIRFR